jgi:hypothetical protein
VNIRVTRILFLDEIQILYPCNQCCESGQSGTSQKVADPTGFGSATPPVTAEYLKNHNRLKKHAYGIGTNEIDIQSINNMAKTVPIF